MFALLPFLLSKNRGDLPNNLKSWILTMAYIPSPVFFFLNIFVLFGFIFYGYGAFSYLIWKKMTFFLLLENVSQISDSL